MQKQNMGKLKGIPEGKGEGGFYHLSLPKLKLHFHYGSNIIKPLASQFFSPPLHIT